MPSLPAWFDPQATGGHRVARLRKSRRRANLKRGGDAARSKHAHGALMMIVKGAQGMIGASDRTQPADLDSAGRPACIDGRVSLTDERG